MPAGNTHRAGPAADAAAQVAVGVPPVAPLVAPLGEAVQLGLDSAVDSPELGRQDTAGCTRAALRPPAAPGIPGGAVPEVALGVVVRVGVLLRGVLRFSRSGVKDSRLDRRCVAGVCQAVQ